MAYEESRARFGEFLDVMRLAWTQERFSSTGTFDTFRDMALIPKPSQHPHPPLHHAATSRETFAAIGTLGCPLLVGLASAAMAELAEGIAAYQAAWQEVGLSGIIMEPNIGGRILYERLLHSMRLFTQEVAPSLR